KKYHIKELVRINSFKEFILTSSFIWYFFHDSYKKHLSEKEIIIEKIKNLIFNNNIETKNTEIVFCLIKKIIFDKEIININKAIMQTLNNKSEIIETYYSIEKEMLFQNKSLFLSFCNNINKTIFEDSIKIIYRHNSFKRINLLLYNYESKADIRKWLLYKIYYNLLKIKKEKND
ncbi:hypothetical protein C4M80_03125, partial [Mycoplasmopsis pullorum]|uniref:hypothetical protein n=1 Tax=Mycoplasmopsis pullorum TaxID=48003 RepID=UPI001C59B294